MDAKPLLVIPPAPARWMSLETLLDGTDSARLADMRSRFQEQMPGARDAFAMIPNGSLCLAIACIRRSGDLAVLGDVFTRPDHRLRGMARSLLQTLLSWFDMTGGKWLYLTTPAALGPAFFENFGFRGLHRGDSTDGPVLTMVRTMSHVANSPYGASEESVVVRELGRSDYPLLVAMLQYQAGADPRVPTAESATSAEAIASELLAQRDRGVCLLLGAERDGVLVGAVSLAIDKLGKRTYALALPHSGAPQTLLDAAVAAAMAKGYEQLDFPLSALGTTFA